MARIVTDEPADVIAAWPVVGGRVAEIKRWTARTLIALLLALLAFAGASGSPFSNSARAAGACVDDAQNIGPESHSTGAAPLLPVKTGPGADNYSNQDVTWWEMYGTSGLSWSYNTDETGCWPVDQMTGQSIARFFFSVGKTISEFSIATYQWAADPDLLAPVYDKLDSIALGDGRSTGLFNGFWATLCLDGVICAASISMLWSTLRGQRATYPWLLVIAFSALSVGGNVLHGQPTVVGVFVAALPPIAFALVWHLLIDLKRSEIVARTAEEEAARLAEEREIEKHRRAEERAARAVDRTPAAPRQRTPVTAPASGVRIVPTDAQTTTAPARPKVSAELLDQARTIVASEPDIRPADLGERLGRTAKTGQRLLAALREENASAVLVG